LLFYEDLNEGFSYGSYSYAYETYRGKFDHYIFVEDDNIFIEDAFDRKLAARCNSLPNCGFLCGFVSLWRIYDKTYNHLSAIVPHGIAKADVLERIHRKHGRIPWDIDFGFHEHILEWVRKGCRRRSTAAGGFAQLSFSQSFLDSGFLLYDFSSSHIIPYRSSTGRIFLFGNHLKAPFVVPFEYMDNPGQLPIRYMDYESYSGDTIR